MASIKIDESRGGTLFTGGIIFGKGVTEIPADKLEEVTLACSDLPWANIVDGPEDEGERLIENIDIRSIDLLSESESESEPALPVASEKLVAAEEFDAEKAQRAERLAELVRHNGEPPKEAAKTGFECPHEGCGKVLKTAQGLKLHIQNKHPEPDAD